jgi:hypothetical protein
MATKLDKKIITDKRLRDAAPNLLYACNSILTTLEEMELGDIEALQDVRKAIAIATNKE